VRVSLGPSLLGLMLIALGLNISQNQHIENALHGYVADFGRYHLLVGLPVIAVGCVFIYLAFRKRRSE
jgi:hypothetical protein